MVSEFIELEAPALNGSIAEVAKCTIVYVDDEEHNLRVFKSLFRKYYDIVLFDNPLEALEYLRREEVAILISDQMMPEMKGTELIEKISEEKDLITIILTGYSDIEVIKDAINRCGIYRFITKPYDFEELKADCNNALENYKLKRDKELLLHQIKEQNAVLEEKVVQRTEELSTTNNRLIESLKYAERIQSAILTDREMLKQAFRDVFIMYKPLEIVSGDFYLFKKIDSKYIIASFDCTGHGVPGAILSMLGSSILNGIVSTHTLRPAELLATLNNKVCEILNSTEDRMNDGMEGSIILYHPEANKLIYSGARSELVLFRNGEMEKVKGERFSIGDRYLAEEEVIEQVKIDTQDVTSFYLFSDGYKDQINEDGTAKYNAKRFNSLLCEIQKQEFDNQQNVLEQELSQWKGSAEQVDDIMILGFDLKDAND
ncbi:MAG: response regulator [Bacteroidota bacterium]